MSFDHKKCKTGVSSYERYLSLISCCDDNTKKEDLTKPGHIYPLISN
jgi:3,4-dihydroxy 2-butanone 4-phosphate synthase/GTP cyclohydrolase II